MEEKNLEVARRWCAAKEGDWSVLETAGRGGTAPVFTVSSPSGVLALKVYDAKFSAGPLGAESERRLTPQIKLGLHDCSHVVRVHDGGRFEDRLFVLMDRASGKELEKNLKDVPRNRIRTIVDQVARAAIFLRGQGLCHRDLKSANIFISDDFAKVTVLDLSVLRDVNDPIGLGTDHGEQLPVVATSRYSPPEYLFRLVPPGPELWHALDIYQLGGVLHDLIMREPMFEQEYQKSRENRYRFAWIVAMQDPVISAPDVDADLVVLAKRALDKNWQRRSGLRLEDFLDESSAHRATGLLALGANIRGKPPSEGFAQINRRMVELAEQVEGLVLAGLKEMGVTTTHEVVAEQQGIGRRLRFSWDVAGDETAVRWNRITFEIRLVRIQGTAGVVINHFTGLYAERDEKKGEVKLSLPDVIDEQGAAAALATASMVAFGELAAQLHRI